MTEESTARRRELGTELRILRKRRNMSGHELGRRLEWPPSNISRLETGMRVFTIVLVPALMTILAIGMGLVQRRRRARARA